MYGSLLALAALVCAGCKRVDTLSVISNDRGDRVIIDAFYGSGSRIICVEESANSSCSKRNAVVVVENALEANDVAAVWHSDDRVEITVRFGRVARTQQPHVPNVRVVLKVHTGDGLR